MQFFPFSGIDDIKDLAKEGYNGLWRRLRDFWNDHDSGVRSWTATSTGNLIIGNNTTSDTGYGTITSVTDSKYYEGHFTAVLTGPYSSTWRFDYTVVGRTVFVTVNANTGTSTSGVRFNVGAGAWPVSLRPTSTMEQAIGPVMTTGTDLPGPGMIVVGTGGDISIYSKMDASVWGGSGTNGLDGNSCFCYQLGI